MRGTPPLASCRPLGDLSHQVLVFRLPGYSCALPLSAVQEIVPLPLLSQPPGLPRLLEGFVNLAGEAIAVLRTDRLFGLVPLSLELHTPLILLRGQGAGVALVVQSVQGIFPRPEWVPPSSGGSFNDCIEGQAILQEEMVYLLSPERILLERERQILEHFQALEQERLGLLEEAIS